MPLYGLPPMIRRVTQCDAMEIVGMHCTGVVSFSQVACKIIAISVPEKETHAASSLHDKGQKVEGTARICAANLFT